MRDLTDAPDELVTRRAFTRVASEGWGGYLLALQSPDGYWGGADDEGWMTTVYSLKLLVYLGVDPASTEARAAIGRVRKITSPGGSSDGRPYFEGETEPCINGRDPCCRRLFRRGE